MTKILLALGTAAIAMTASVPAAAARNVCTQWRHGHCAVWRTTHPRAERRAIRRAERRAAYRVGYRFGPSYGYTAYSALPRTYVTRYHLSPRYRYVYNNGYIYVVNPTTYAITRILSAL